jgi:hypothetical protein
MASLLEFRDAVRMAGSARFDSHETRIAGGYVVGCRVNELA